jgi:hypothetical protein
VTVTAPPRAEAQARRRDRHDLRRGISHFTTLRRVKYCGAPIGASVGVKHDADAGAGFAGTETCGSVWACPVCASKIAARRAHELTAVLEQGKAAGLQTAMLTFTVRHGKDDLLLDVWNAVQSGWHAITSGKRWKREQHAHGVQGWVRAVEATVGDNGWHVHIHALVLLSGDAHALGRYAWERWEAGINRAGFTAIRDSGGFDVVVASDAVTALGDYLIKMGAGKKDLGGLAREATFGQGKSGRLGGRTPFQVAADIADLDEMHRRGVELDVEQRVQAQRDYMLWQEWEIGSHRRRALTWSKGLREWANLDDERSDEEIAGEEPGGDFVLTLPRETYLALRRRDELPTVLDLIENAGGSTSTVEAWLSTLGLSWGPPPRAERGTA